MSGSMLQRRDVVRAVLSNRGDLMAVMGLGQPCYDAMAAGDDPKNFYLWGAMGGAVPVAIGLAAAQPRRRTLAITGDGEMLMGVGSLATAAAENLANLAVVVLDNERYGETGSQMTHTARGTDLAGIARASGFRQVVVATDEISLAEAIHMIREGVGPVFALIKVSPDAVPMVLPPKDGQYLKNRLREAILEDPGV